MTDTHDHPTIVAVINELQDIVSERNALREEVARLKAGPAQALAKAFADRPNKRKLNNREVENIRSLKRSGYSQREIADIYDINPATVSRIVRGQYHRKAGAA